MECVHSTRKERLMQGLSERERARVRSAGGPGAGAYQLAPLSGVEPMPSGAWRIATRRRLLFSMADVISPQPLSTHCQRRSRAGVCGRALNDDVAEHRVSTCKIGGGVVRARNDVRDFLLQWVKKHIDPRALKEQRMDSLRRAAGGAGAAVAQ
eukprot:296718-Pyramimonas_sp.AAC.1